MRVCGNISVLPVIYCDGVGYWIDRIWNWTELGTGLMELGTGRSWVLNGVGY